MTLKRTTTLTGFMAIAKRAAQRRQQRPTTAHAVLAMLQHDPETSRLLSARGIREIDLISALKITSDEPTSAMEVAAERAARLAERAGHDDAGPLHLLAAIVREPRTAGYRCLESVGTSPTRVREDVLEALGVTHASPMVPPVPCAKARPPPAAGSLAAPRNRRVRPPSARRGTPPPDPKRGPFSGRAPEPPEAPPDAVDPAEPAPPSRGPGELDPARFPLLFRIGRNLTAAAAAGRIDPVVGRDHELDRLLDVLARRRANNPILVGPPGVGKTAIVEGLALRLVADRARLGDVTLIEVSAGALVSGTGVRGALADKLRQLVRERAPVSGARSRTSCGSCARRSRAPTARCCSSSTRSTPSSEGRGPTISRAS